MYSLIGTAKLNGIDPQAHLRYFLTHIADYLASRIDDLLPWNYFKLLSTVALTLPRDAR